MTTHEEEDVIQDVKQTFIETIELKMRQLRRYVPKGANSALTGIYVEAIVRQFVQKWIGHRRLCSGTFHSQAFKKSGQKPLQIDGIIYDPHAGPLVLEEDNFIVVHPAFCTSVIEIKTSLDKTVEDFENRLKQIHRTYCPRWSYPNIMGIVIQDKYPEKKSDNAFAMDGKRYPFYYFRHANFCPIFILFEEKDDDLVPFMPAIDSMIRAIYTSQHLKCPGGKCRFP